MTRDPRATSSDDDPTHARHEADHPEWARFRRPGTPEPIREPRAPEPAPPSVPPPGRAERGSDSEPEVAPAPEPAAPAFEPGDGSAELPGAIPAAVAGPPDSSWRPPLVLEPDLEPRIRRDLRRGRAVVLLTWVAAFASLVLGLVAVRQATLLVAIDPRLVTFEEVEAAGRSFDVARSILIVVVILGALLTVRWFRDAVVTLDRLRELGVVDGPPTRGGLDRLRLLIRPTGVPADRVGWSDVRPGSRRGLNLLTAGVVIAATIVGLAAALLLGAATNADESRMLRVVSGIDGALWMLASILVGAALDQVRWREAAAARALGIFIPLVDAPSRTLVRILPPALLFGAGILIATGRPDPWFVPCPSVTLVCDGMLVPADHQAPAGPTIWVVYAVHHATGPAEGTLAIAVGGPGESGLDDATAVVDALDPELVRRYDLLFFDQRGIGASEGRDCPKAGLQYATTATTASTAAAFVDACLTEAGVDRSTLQRYATRQAAQDLDSIRERLGIGKFVLYGESYGTEFAQAYAALFPDRLNGLILDGPVDLTRSANTFWADAAKGFSKVLSDTLAGCASDRACRADVPDPSTAYDDLLRRFGSGDDVSFADPDGEVRAHRVDASAIETAVDILLYDPEGRMLIQRAVAAAANHDDVPAARLVDALGGGEGLGVSTFAYHAITCADYRVSPTADPADFAALEQFAHSVGVADLRTDEVFTSQYPCLYWPYQPPDTTRPAPLTTTPFPVFVLGADDDPITPIAGAQAIAARLSDGYLIRTRGGPHVTYGRGDSCVDGPINAFLLEDRRPATRSLDCPGTVAAPYIELAPTSKAALGDALEAMFALDDELFADPDYVLWDGRSELRFGCRSGGFVAISPETLQDGIRFASCAIVPGFAVTGLGTYVFDTKTVTWSIKGPDLELDYERTPDGGRVTGTWNGSKVDLSR